MKLPLVAEEEKDEIGKTDENVFQIIRCTRENYLIPHKKNIILFTAKCCLCLSVRQKQAEQLNTFSL